MYYIKPIKIKLDLGNARELVDILKKATNLMQGTGSSSAHASVVQTINSRKRIKKAKKRYKGLF